MDFKIRGPSIKKVRTQHSGGLTSADIFRPRRKGVLQMRTSALFSAKNSGFLNLWRDRTDKEEGG